ncbi:17612_t:CDS:2, partial [Racocetra persica]
QTQVIINVPKASSTKDIPQPIDSRSEGTNVPEEMIIPDEIEHSPAKSESLTELEESEIQCSASPSATSLPQDDISKQITETILSKNDQDGNLCNIKTVPLGNDRDVNLSCDTKTISSEISKLEQDVECDKNEIVEQGLIEELYLSTDKQCLIDSAIGNTNSTENKGPAQHLSYLFKTAIKSRQQEILNCEEIDRDSDPSEVKIQVSAPDDSRSGDAIASKDSNYEYNFEDSFDNNEDDSRSEDANASKDDDGFCGFSDDDDEGYYYDLNTGETYTKSEYRYSIRAY